MELPFLEDWAEIYAVVFIVIGFIIAITLQNIWMNYVVSVAIGIVAGRFLHEKKIKGIFPFFMIVIGLMLGYLLGTTYADRRITALLFVIFAIISYKYNG